MTLPVLLLVVFLVSLFTSMAVAGRLRNVNLTNRLPELRRHWTNSHIPRLGGVAVFAALPVAILAAASVNATLSKRIPAYPDLAGALIVSGAILFLVGLLDDIRGIRPVIKLIAQTAAALVVYYAGFRVTNVSFFPGHVVELGFLALPITVLWLVGVSNAFNLIDGLDGLAGGVAIIALGAIACVALLLGNPSVPIYAVGLIGSLLGFLRYNFPSARLYMGDSGSLVVGFLLAVLAVKGSTTSSHVTYGLIPIFALSYPLLDTGIAILRRWLRGVPLSRADRRHIHHQLASLGLSPRRAVIVLYAISAAIAGLGLSATFAPPEVTAVATMIGVGALLFMIAGGIYWLDYHEFAEAGSSIASAARNARSVIQDKIHARDLAKAIRNARTIDEIETILEDNAAMFRFAHMKLASPTMRKRAPGRITQELQALKLWKLEYPVVEGGRDEFDGLCLTIWCSLTVSQRPAGAERVAQIIAPAIGAWVRRASDPVLLAPLLEGASGSTNGLRRGDLTLEELRALDEPTRRPQHEKSLEA